MATQTTHYHLIKPTSAERVAVGDINDNSDIIDGNLFTANERADQMADDYNASETYNTGDYVRRENYLYKCNTDNTTGTWDSTKWDRVKVIDAVETAEDGVDNAFKTMGVMGAKNLNSIPYYHNSRTINYVDWTINDDGSVTANGTATGGNSNFACHSRHMEAGKLVLPNGNYILSGCATGGSSSTWEIVIERTHNGSAETIAINQSGDTEFTLNGDDYSADCVQVQLILRVRNNQQANNITFHPMIRLASVKDDTYTPYAMTNKNLTDIVKCKQTTAGTYTLQATVASNGVVTYAWVPTT